MSAFESALNEIFSLEASGINRGLDRVLEALALLGNPQNQFKSVHIAGTNGKGSTSAMTASILREAGYKAGLTVSPHIQDYRERIQIDGEWISPLKMTRVHERLKARLKGIPLTFFEWTILMAFEFFAEEKVDFAVLETGMGGRWDATNAALPLVGAITNVGLDHQEFLGPTLPQILDEKMQIFKPGMEAWTGIRDGALLAILKNHCGRKGIRLQSVADFFDDQGDSFSMMGLTRLKPGLAGEHQKQNAALAIAIAFSLREKGYAISDDAIRDGISRVFWPGRLEQFNDSFLLDGAHNPDGIRSLARFLENNNRTFDFLLFGTLSNRPLVSMALALKPFAKKIYLANFSAKQSFSRLELETLLREIPFDEKEILDGTHSELARFYQSLSPQSSVLVTGSLYWVAQMRTFLQSIS